MNTLPKEIAQDNIHQDHVIVSVLPSVMGFTIQEMVQQGWEIDPDMPVAQVGFNWECGFKRVISAEQAEKEAAIAAKPSRADILAKARAAKASKKGE